MRRRKARVTRKNQSFAGSRSAAILEATKRLAEILSTHTFAIETSGEDRYGRVLARFLIGHTTAGEMLVAERLAQSLSGRREEWCEKARIKR